ncbi:hypothetical protein [Rugosimonospora africana]|nr:hypothetical protein [Rugosimonospora africana]
MPVAVGEAVGGLAVEEVVESFVEDDGGEAGLVEDVAVDAGQG